MLTPNRPSIKLLYIISDGTGETAEKLLRAALHQFRGYLVHVIPFPHVTTETQLKSILEQAKKKEAMVVSTLVSGDIRTKLEEMAAQLRIRHTDVIGSLLAQLSIYLRAQPQGLPNQMHQVNDEYFRRIEAVEFTVRGDDGKNPRMLNEADIILLGVSRTSKTPLSVFLAHKGYKVCNIPIVLHQKLPPSLFEIDERRIFSLTIDAEVLQQIRKQRLKTMRVQSKSSYSSMGYILEELEWADDLYRANPTWPVIDVTQKAVEETAAVVLNILSDRGLTHEFGEVSQL
jgi:regulator of PEP synthase PpsR (kinase-PPPase family)